MADLTLTYEGEDVLIPREQIEALGVRPGDKIVIRPALQPGDEHTLAPAVASGDSPDRAEIEGLLNELGIAWPGELKASERDIRQLLERLKPSD